MATKNISGIRGVRVPQPSSIEFALQLYYEKAELSSSDIKQLFSVTANSTVSRLKDLAREQMASDGTPSWDARNVNTAAAYQSWGIDPADLERRVKKLRELREMAV